MLEVGATVTAYPERTATGPLASTDHHTNESVHYTVFLFGSTRWDFERLAITLQRGRGRREFLDELQARLKSDEGKLSGHMEDPAPDEHWKTLLSAMKYIGMKHVATRKAVHTTMVSEEGAGELPPPQDEPYGACMSSVGRAMGRRPAPGAHNPRQGRTDTASWQQDQEVHGTRATGVCACVPWGGGWSLLCPRESRPVGRQVMV